MLATITKPASVRTKFAGVGDGADDVTRTADMGPSPARRRVIG